MKKKSKKQSPQQLKLEQAHQKNLYLKKLKTMMGIMGSESAFDLLGPFEIELIYKARLRPVRFICANDMQVAVSAKDLKLMGRTFNHILNIRKVNLGPDRKTVTLYDFCTYIETIHVFWNYSQKNKFPNSDRIFQELSAFGEKYKTERIDFYKQIEDNILMVSWLSSNVQYKLVWMEKKPTDELDSSNILSNFYNNYLVHTVRPETLSISIDGIKRTVFRVGFSYQTEGVNWLSVLPEKFGVEGLPGKLPINVYIQSHVMDRMRERLGYYFHELYYMQIILSIMLNKPEPLEQGGFLFSVDFPDYKVGYLLGTIIDNRLIIRTFLFLTNNGTPEGRKLSELLGLQKADKKYFGIDKLKTFIESDIEQNKTLKDIFCQAGCSNLFKVKNNFRESPNQTIRCADYLSRYLGLEMKNRETHQKEFNLAETS